MSVVAGKATRVIGESRLRPASVNVHARHALLVTGVPADLPPPALPIRKVHPWDNRRCEAMRARANRPGTTRAQAGETGMPDALTMTGIGCVSQPGDQLCHGTL